MITPLIIYKLRKEITHDSFKLARFYYGYVFEKLRRTMENNEKINVFGILQNGREDFKRCYHKSLN